MFEVAGIVGTIVGIIGGGIGVLAAILSVIYQRRQTRLMEGQVDRAIEVKITRDLDAPEGVIDNKLRAFLNRRLSDIRTQMRQEFSQRLDEIIRMIEDSHIADRRDIAVDAVTLLSDQKGAVADFKEFNGKVSILESEIQTLQQAVEDIRNGVGGQAMVRAQIRGIAQQLLHMSGQE